MRDDQGGDTPVHHNAGSGHVVHHEHRSIPAALAAAAARDATTGITLLAERAGGPSRHRSYRELWVDARRVAARLEALGVARGDRVLLVFPTSFEFVAAFIGVQLRGAIPVPAYPPVGLRMQAGLERLAHVARQAEIRVILTSPVLRAACGDVALRARGVAAVEVVDAPEHPSVTEHRSPVTGHQDYESGPDDPAFIQFTSGSTGRPKGVLLSHRNLLANMQASGDVCAMAHDDVMVSWLPLYHDMGLIGGLLYSIYWQIPLVLMSPAAFLRQPIRWLRAISEHGGTLSAAPNFAYALCVHRVPQAEREGLDLSTWRLAYNGAEPVSAGTLRGFESAYAPHGFRATAAFPVYGLAEASLSVTFPQSGGTPRHDCVDRAQLGVGRAMTTAAAAGGVTLVSVGSAVPGHEIRIVDEQGTPCTERIVGEVLVRGPSVMQGYFRDPAATARVIRDGWLHTGDLGYVADGELYLVGRAKDLIIVRGRNVYPEDLERTAETVPGVRGGGTVAFGVYDEAAAEERLVLVCETKVVDGSERRVVEASVRRVVQEAHDVTLHEVKLVVPGTIPKTSSGKRQRSRCRDLHRRDALRPSRATMRGGALVLVRGALGLGLVGVRRWLRHARGGERSRARPSV